LRRGQQVLVVAGVEGQGEADLSQVLSAGSSAAVLLGPRKRRQQERSQNPDYAMTTSSSINVKVLKSFALEYLSFIAPLL